jgi:hypothetical protein
VTQTAPAPVEAIGSLAHELAEEVPPGQDAPFHVQGRRARVDGTARGGAERVWLNSASVMSAVKVEGADVLGVLLSPLGIERRLRVGGAEVDERIVVPRDASFVLFEWESRSRLPAEVRWSTPLELGGPEGGDLRAVGSGTLVAFRVSGSDAEWVVRPGGAGRHRGGVAIVLPGDGPVQLAVAGGGDPDELARALRAAARGGVVTESRRGLLARLRQDRLALDSPDAALDVGVERAKARLSDALPATHSIPDSLLAGDFDHARQALYDASQPGAMGDSGTLARVAGLYLAWTGDSETLYGSWARVVAAWDGGKGWQDVLHMAEALGDSAVAAAARAARDRGVPADLEGSLPRDPALATVHRLLGPEPDASRGRLVLRPRPPGGWDVFQVRNLVVGDAAVDVVYRRTDDTHCFEVEQTRGAAPVRVVLEPELEGVLRCARVDGVGADLTAVPANGRSRVPVQIVLDHRRSVELEMEEKKDARR